MSEGPISADGTVQSPAPEDIYTDGSPGGPEPTVPEPETPDVEFPATPVTDWPS